MIRSLPFLHLSEPKCPPLVELDGLYQSAISELPVCTKRDYCERLIRRTEFELTQAKCKKEIRTLKTLRNAAKNEIYKLDVSNQK